MLTMIADKVRALYPEAAEGSDRFLHVIDCYRADVQRRATERSICAEDVTSLSECIRIAS